MKLEHAASPDAGIKLNGVDEILSSKREILKVNRVANLTEGIRQTARLKCRAESCKLGTTPMDGARTI